MRFGTDGIRGVFGLGINAELAYLAGKGTAAALGGGKILLGMDTRKSSKELYRAAKDGLISGGADVVLLGVVPSPAVSYLCSFLGARGGVMITASHNPPEYNGIKVFGKNGLKASEDEERQIDYSLSNPQKSLSRGKAINLDGASIYLNHLKESVGDLSGLKIVCDAAHGATHEIMSDFFSTSGASVKAINTTPDGGKINVDCGALYPNLLAPYTLGGGSKNIENCQKNGENTAKNDDNIKNNPLHKFKNTEISEQNKGYDISFSLDGDGDRVSVCKGGNIISGDTILYNLSLIMNASAVVGTVLNNSALETKLKEKNKQLFRTAVGDKHILRLMYQNNYMLGGEQSGHYIVRPHSVTADGLMTAGLLAKHLANGGQLEELELVPQRSISRFASASRLECSDVQSLIKNANERLLNNGRLVLRMSGTEPKIRLMVESTNPSLIDEILSEFDQLL